MNTMIHMHQLPSLKYLLLLIMTQTLFASPSMSAPDIEISKTKSLTMSHSLSWVMQNAKEHTMTWDAELDEINWGTPADEMPTIKNWDFRLTDKDWFGLVEQHGAAPEEEAVFDLWVPGDVQVVKGVIAISSHGSGKPLYEDEALRAIARELDLALFRFVGNPVQRGFWPRSLLSDLFAEFGQEADHPELINAPLFLYGHSNGTGFSSLFTAGASDRVWAWMSMRPGFTYQVYQPEAAKVPGLVIFGEDDDFLARPTVKENLSVVPLMRRQHDAVWNMVVEPETGHAPTDKTWPLVYSFLKHSFKARVPENADPRKGPVSLIPLDTAACYRGQNWDSANGGYQTLEIAPVDSFTGDTSSASWLLNADYAKDWQAFQRDGALN